MFSLRQMRLILLSVTVFSFLLVNGCQTTDNQAGSKTEVTQIMKDVREIAWNSLSNSEREEVIGKWKEAEISKTVANTKRFFLQDRSFEGKEVTIVTFRSTKSALLGDITKLVDEKSQKVVGGGFRE